MGWLKKETKRNKKKPSDQITYMCYAMRKPFVTIPWLLTNCMIYFSCPSSSILYSQIFTQFKLLCMCALPYDAHFVFNFLYRNIYTMVKINFSRQISQIDCLAIFQKNVLNLVKLPHCITFTHAAMCAALLKGLPCIATSPQQSVNIT